MTEMVYRRRRRSMRMMDARRFVLPIPTRQTLSTVGHACIQAAPGLLMGLADLMDMPSGLHAAYIASLGVLGLPAHWPLAGAAAAMVLRLLSGLSARWENLLTLLVLSAAPKMMPGRRNPGLLLFTGAALLPMVIRGWMAPTALPALLAMASMAFSVLCAPVICRGIKAVMARDDTGRPRALDDLEDRLGVAALALLMMCGGARLLIGGLNAGMLLAASGVLALAVHLGGSAGCAAGIIAGMGLGLAGLPMMHCVSLAAGGFLAGAMQGAGRRWLCSLSFGAVTLLIMAMTGTAGTGCAPAVVAVSAAALCIPERAAAILQEQLCRLRRTPSAACDAYASSMLRAWEQTVDAMAMSVPMPGSSETPRDAAWWREHLCSGCEEAQLCPCIRSDAAVTRVEAVWAYREAEDAVWQGALEGLRGMGCQRLYHLQQGMDMQRREDAVEQRQLNRARDQRSMLVTHLTAMAGAARRFAHLSHGETWWDALTARRIRAALSDAAAPVRLMWLRRIQGHVETVFRLEDITHARGQADELCALVSAATGVPMMTVRIDQGRVRIAQRPPMKAVCGLCSISAAGQSVCGDTAWHGLLQDGRFMAAVSDGMGHGDTAALSSRQTVELLRLCLDAGYTMQQTLDAVNGMMLLGGSGERFIAVDLFCMDLWTGKAWLEKMGGAGSWLQHDGAIHQLTGDALPLGIIEGMEPGERLLHMHPGDTLILLTDGVEEAFDSRAALQDAVCRAMEGKQPQQAAQELVEAADTAARCVRRDDQTVLVIRIEGVQNDEKGV